MKTVLSALTILLSTVPSAFAWETVVDCDQGAFVIDRHDGKYGRFEYQAIFRFDVIDHLNAENQIQDSDVNEYGELIRNLGLSENVPHYGRLPNGTSFLFQDSNAGDAYVLGFSASDRTTTSIADYAFTKCDFKFGPVGQQ
jgi:hypothetical protein